MERSPSEVMLFPTCNAVSSLGDGRSNHQSQPRASPSLVSFPIILDHDDNNLEAGAAAGLYQSRCRTGNSINEVATFRERQTSCDSSSCTVCHCTRHSVDSLLTSCATRPVSNFRSTGNLSDHFSTRRSSLGKRPSLSSLPRGSGSSSNMHISASDSDLASLATEGASSTTAYDPMEEEFEDCKQARRFSRQWMRSVDRMSVPQTWGHSLENVSASVPAPIRAQFSEVCSLAEPDGSDGGSSSGRRTAKHIFQDLLVNCNGLLLAGASRAKQVCIYDLQRSLQDSSSMNTPEPLKMHRVPSRVSSLSWSPQQQSLLAMGDTDGVLWRLDAISGHVISEIDENGGDKIWSICHSPLHRDVIASSWGNGAVSIWDTTCGAAQRICSIQTPKKMPVCSIDICGTFLAMASSDHNVYVYDLRNPLDPHMVLRRHVRPVSYVRFMGTRLVSSSVDGSVVLWDGISSGSPTVRKSFSSHKNEKNFVGLSVDSNQLIACGSEDGSAYVYFPAWEQPVAYTTPAASCFVTSLAWIPTASLKLHLEETPPILAVADTSGSLKLHALIRSEGFQDPASFGSH